jgi:hypothetical protein
MQDWQGVRQGFATPGLGNTNQRLAFEQPAYGARLDLSGTPDAKLFEARDKRGEKIKIRER